MPVAGAAVAAEGNGCQRGSLAGGTGAVVTAVVAAAVVAAGVTAAAAAKAAAVAVAVAAGDSSAGSFPLARAPAWCTQQRSQTGESVSQMG